MSEHVVIPLRSRALLDLCHPDPAMFDIAEIAHSLSQLCRFTGHTRPFHSVGQHSLRLSYAVPKALAFDALMDDCEEAYTGDIHRNLKHSVYLERFVAEIAAPLKLALQEHYGYVSHPTIHKIDQEIGTLEKAGLLYGEDVTRLYGEAAPVFWTCEETEYRFLERFKYLKRR